MSTIRLMPPADATFGPNPITVNGRTYSAAVGATIDVPDFDALVMKSNGWTASVEHTTGVGTTAARPTVGLTRGVRYLDSTLGYVIQWDGKAWRNPATGAAV